jgi:hypothetical protein
MRTSVLKKCVLHALVGVREWPVGPPAARRSTLLPGSHVWEWECVFGV